MTPFVTRAGHGSARVLAIHCTLAHSGAWKGFTRAMHGTAEVTAFDLPNHGKSPDWPLDQDQHRLATDWGLDVLMEPMHLVGHSYGGTVALRMALDAPDRVLSLTLFEPVFLAAARKDQPERFKAHEAELAEYAATIERGDFHQAARAFNRVWGDGTPWYDFPAETRAYMADRIHFVKGSAPFLIEDNAGLLEGEAFSNLSLPVILAQGEFTLDVIDATMAALARRIPNARRICIDGAGHMAPITHPAELAKIVGSQIATQAT
ncbi:MAG: alpha/beta hydrolase [Paracoccaceae bacterium]